MQNFLEVQCWPDLTKEFDKNFEGVARKFIYKEELMKIMEAKSKLLIDDDQSENHLSILVVERQPSIPMPSKLPSNRKIKNKLLVNSQEGSSGLLRKQTTHHSTSGSGVSISTCIEILSETLMSSYNLQNLTIDEINKLQNIFIAIGEEQNEMVYLYLISLFWYT